MQPRTDTLRRAASAATIALGLALLTLRSTGAASPAPGSAPPGVLPEWTDYMEQFKASGNAVLKMVPHPEDPQARQETWKALTASIAGNFLQYTVSDPDYPEFVSIYNTALNLLAPNADTMYTWTRINGAGVYRIRGFRNSAHYVEISFQEGSFLEPPAATVANLDLDSLRLAPDGSFELLLSAERPKNYAGNWFALPPRCNSLLVRSVSYDWVHERDAVLAIERLDVPAARPRPSAAQTAASLAELPRWVEASQKFSYNRFADLEAKQMRNRFLVHDYVAPGKAHVQTYLESLYDIADDEALILETQVPNTCRYWSFLVTDDQFGTVDWMNHQSSLNGFQAKIDQDGKFRAVISVHDPGVPNWLDTGGYLYGIIQGRWNKCSSDPIPTLRKVKLADLRNYLPPGTAVISTAERDASLRERRLGAQLRRRW
jgi:hypothetical protein